MVNYNKVLRGIKSDDKNVKTAVKEVINETPPPKEPTIAIVANCHSLNVRDKPNLQGGVIAILRADDTVLVESIVDGWAHINSIGIEGYVMADYIKEE